ncbi:MAG: homoserine dehydrogenase, partial [Candidatus Omnitrophota bacterium]
KVSKTTKLTKNIDDIINDDSIDVLIELIGGMNPSKQVVIRALSRGKDVITANKGLIASCGQELFALARKNNCFLYYESAVGAGIPIIKTISEGIAGNLYNGVYGIVNGTCNFILDEMASKNLTFADALKLAQDKGYAESDPTLDINGMDATYKLAILINLAFGKFIDVKDIYTEGIDHLSHDDIEAAESLNLSIKLLAIAKEVDGKVEARVHPTLIKKSHPLASINGVLNGVFLDTTPLGNILLSGEGAGQYAAASGVVSDLINLVSHDANKELYCNEDKETVREISKLDDVETKFYLRFQATDKAGVLSEITGLLGKANIGINSVTQKMHTKAKYVPVIMLTETTTERKLRGALDKIGKLKNIKVKPVAIRMERL